MSDATSPARHGLSQKTTAYLTQGTLRYAEDEWRKPLLTDHPSADLRVLCGSKERTHTGKRWRACALLLAALGAVLAVPPSRGVSSESAAPEAKTEVYQAWPFDAAEAKRRQEETAKRLGIPVERTLDLGNGVRLDLVLIPAGRFIMGTPEPEPVDEVGFQSKILTGQVVLGISGGAFLILLGVVLIRAIRKRQWPQYSLAWFLVMTVVAGIGLMGGLHGYFSAQELAEAQSEYEAALARFKRLHPHEWPAHDVTIGSPFYIGKFEVTREHCQQVLGTNPSGLEGPDFPVAGLLWDDTQDFCKTVGHRVTGSTVRLPTEAEWEYVCRAGTTTAYCSGDVEADLDKVGWYSGNGRANPHPVGEKAANSWGVHDMHGNVAEWCEDNWHYSYEGAPSDGRAWVDDSPNEVPLMEQVDRGGAWLACSLCCTERGHVVRGGAFIAEAWFARCAARNFICYSKCNSVGFRVVVEVSKAP